MGQRFVRRVVIVAFLMLSLGAFPLWADAGVFAGNGQNLHQITSKAIQLTSIDVTIVLGRGPFLFDGSVPGMDRAEYSCTFVLRSLSEKGEDVRVGFPIDSEFASQASNSPSESQDWISDYAFMASDDQVSYHVQFVRRKPKPGPGEFGSVFVWDMHFGPKQTRALHVQYRIPISMGLVALEKQGSIPSASGAFGQEFLDTGELEMAGYITSTGSSWAGNVEAATFRLITVPFERYLNYRGFTEETNTERTFKELQQTGSSFPVRHPWWFRQISPDGWKPIEGGVQWQYKNYKPKDSLSVKYYITQFPRLPAEADVFVDRFLRGLGPNDSAIIELGRLRQVLLATYGKEPNDSVARAFVSEQLWYKPDKHFSPNHLSQSQTAILKTIDYRIAKLREK